MARSAVMRDILDQVARGSLSPEEADARLDELEREEPIPGSRPEPETGTAREIRIVRQRGQVEVVGDPSVKEVTVEGLHIVRREGDTLVIEGEDDWDDHVKQRESPPRSGHAWGGWDDFPGFIFTRRFSGGWMRGWDSRPLVVRMNPHLPLEITLQAGSARIRGVLAPIRAEVQAGATSIDGFTGPLTLSVQAGSVRASGRLDHGESRIFCEAGSVQLHLLRESSVRITARSSIGKISLPTGDGWVVGGSDREATIGAGAATLDIETTAGAVRVTAEQ